MIKAELAKINKNKLIKIAMVIIMLIPAIYSVTFCVQCGIHMGT